MSGIKRKRKVVMTVTADAADADSVDVKFDFFPNLGGVQSHPGLTEAALTLLKLVGNKFKIRGKAVEE